MPPGYAAAVAARAEEKKGRFIRAQWGRTELTAGDTVTAHVEAHGLEGAALVFLVESEAADGSWRHVTHWEGEILSSASAMVCERASGPAWDQQISRCAQSLQACLFRDVGNANSR